MALGTINLTQNPITILGLGQVNSPMYPKNSLSLQPCDKAQHCTTGSSSHNARAAAHPSAGFTVLSKLEAVLLIKGSRAGLWGFIGSKMNL